MFLNIKFKHSEFLHANTYRGLTLRNKVIVFKKLNTTNGKEI